MPSPDLSQEESPSLASSTASHLLTQFTTFLTLFIHSLLYHRSLYPSTSFTAVRAYNLPVHQSRHPGVCQWINDAVSATAEQIHEGTAEKIVFTVLHRNGRKAWQVKERWIVDVSAFPAWGKPDAEGDGTTGADESDEQSDGEQQEEEPEPVEGEVSWSDVNEALRGALRRVGYAAEKMDKLPEGSTFTLAVELRDRARAPIVHPQHWIPSETNPKKIAETHKPKQKFVPAESTLPVRSVHAGPLFFECWVEQARTGSSSSVDQTTPRAATKEASS